MHDPIFLVGFMGSGKSTIGRHLADALGRRFIDTDVFVETRFRQRITDMSPSMAKRSSVVVSVWLSRS